ncbi:MAG: hypothetical protein NZ519_02590 [Bacteroidia bacterium]|nr:hypothetical protein [Bacteroidia bacterium]
MIIANPIYDAVFKQLMQNERIAKFFISTLTEQEIQTIQLKPNKLAYTYELIATRIFRLDFVATIKTPQGYQKILIEIQKAFKYIDIMRFRNYLAEHYKKQDEIEGEEKTLPITTIYILGFDLPEIDSACFRAERVYRDLLTREVIPKKSSFVESLTHDSYIVQVNRIGGRYRSKLEQLLSLFEQRYFIDEKGIMKEYPHEVSVEEVGLMARVLEHVAADRVQRQLIETEWEAWRSIDALTGGVGSKLDRLMRELEQEKQRAEQEKQRAEQKEKELEQEKQRAEQKEKELEQEKQRAEQKEKELQQEKQRAEQLEQDKINMIREMLKQGFSKEVVMQIAKVDESFLKKYNLI